MNEQDELFDNLLSEYFNHTISVEDRENILYDYRIDSL